MAKQESLLAKICKGTTPFCDSMDDEDSYIIEDTPKEDSNNK